MKSSSPFVAPLFVVLLACSPASPAAPTAPSSPHAAPTPEAAPVLEGSADSTRPAEPDDARGGRLYDRWTGEAEVDAPDAIRLKNLYGWDLRGAEGIYGPEYQNKSGVSARNLLAAPQPEDALVAWLSAGDEELPGLGAHLDDAALRELAVFIAMTQRGELPGPDAFFRLSKDAPKNYELVSGADVAAGRTTYGAACAHCHGSDGTTIPIDETLSLGAFMRGKAYEGWFKVLHGHPGSPMGREIAFDSPQEATTKTLGILAALCDRDAYPALEGQADVADGDPRCGAYLK